MTTKQHSIEAAKWLLRKEKLNPGTYSHQAIIDAVNVLEQYGVIGHADKKIS